MKTIYYVILQRPKTCNCWTPVHHVWCHPAGNFFADFERAVERADELAGSTEPIWLAGDRCWVPVEFKIGKVMIDEAKPLMFTSPDPSPNLGKPQPRSFGQTPLDGGADAQF